MKAIYLMTVLAVLIVSACGSSGSPTSAREGEPCGVASCADGLFCKHPVGECGESSEDRGVCEIVPEMCAQLYKPVCGCDGKTYGNECAAASRGVSVRSQGACDKE